MGEGEDDLRARADERIPLLGDVEDLDPDDPGLTGAERELAARDLGFAADLLPLAWWFVERYFRAEVRGMEHIPKDQPVLFVGNHSGGWGSIDSVVFILAFFEHVGRDHPVYWLAHRLVMQVPGLADFLNRCGAITGTRENAEAALSAGASVVVYPGGEVELHRPWTARNEIRFHGRKGFLRLALGCDVPIVPVVAHGAHNTFLPLTTGEEIARSLKLDRLMGLKTLPVSLGLPWGINVGGLLPNIPLPAKITVELLPPVDVRERFGDDLDAAYDFIVGEMQATLTRLAEAR